MQAVRAPAVAGSFYPADPSQLRETVARLLAGAAYGAPPKALIAPHAGYAYSGPIAASALPRVEDAPLSRVVLLGPSHFAPLRGLALPRLAPDDACGAAPVNGLLLAAKRRGLRAELIDLRNSGDTAGDRKRVVGYGAFAFYEK